jgi:hypothetical protein
MSTRGPRRGPCMDVSKVHVLGPLIFVSQMSIFRVLHAWTILKSTRGHLFPAGLCTPGLPSVKKENTALSRLTELRFLIY